MKNVKRTIVSLMLIAGMLLSAVALLPVNAKNVNYTPDVYKIDYLNAGGTAEIAMPEALKTIFSTYTQMRIRVSHAEIPNADISCNNLMVSFFDPAREAKGKDPWEPYAMITDGDAAFEKTFWKGTYANMDATLYNYVPPSPKAGQPLPSFLSADNVIPVEKGVLTVERNGNTVIVHLNAEQTIKKAFTYPMASFKLPVFTLEMKSYGPSSHESTSVIMSGWPGATGYTIIHDSHQFQANGNFASPGSYLDGKTTINAVVLMQGTHTFLKPTTP